VILLAPVLAQPATWTFDADREGAPPAGYTFSQTRQTSPGVWVVQRTGTNGYLVHEPGAATETGFSLALIDGTRLRRGRMAVRLKLAGGERSGGLIWGYRDAQNYYMANLDLQEQEVALYRVVNGNRVRLDREDDLELDPDAWHVLAVTTDDDSVRVYLGGIRVFGTRRREDSEAGGVGVWSAGRSLSWYDDVRVTPHEGSRR
jgi:hypothetical protein